MGRRRRGEGPLPLAALAWAALCAPVSSLGAFPRRAVEDGAVSLFQHSLRRAQRSDLNAKLWRQDSAAEHEDSGVRAPACPAGYGRVAGDVPGWDQFGRDKSNKQPSIELCAADCGRRPECASFEWSATSKVCSLNKVAQPTLAGFEDYVFCQRSAANAGPERRAAAAGPDRPKVGEKIPRCPVGYELLDGDVPGWDQFGRGTGNKKDSLELCVADCEEREECLSLEWSPTSKTCSLNKVAAPTAAKYQDFTFCKRRRQDTPKAHSFLLKREGAAEDIPRPASAAAKEAAPLPQAVAAPLPAALVPAQAAEPAPAPAAQAAKGSVRKDAERSGCPEGYVFAKGDIKGGDQFGREKNRKSSLEQCAADCARKATCKSLEWSPSKRSCNLNKVVGPVSSKYKDYMLCLRSTETLEAPAAPAPAPAAALPAPAPAPATPTTPVAEPEPTAAAPQPLDPAPATADAGATQAAPEAPEQPDPGEASAEEASATLDGEEASSADAASTAEGAPQEATELAADAGASGASEVALPAQETATDEAAAAGPAAVEEAETDEAAAASAASTSAGVEADGKEAEPEALTEAALPRPAAAAPKGKAAARGNPDCWVDGYTFDACCDQYFGPSGNANCWDGAAFTYSRCCLPKEAPPAAAAAQSPAAAQASSAPAPAEPPAPAVLATLPAPAPAPAPAPPMAQPVPLQPPRPQAPFQAGDLVEVADAEGGNPLTAWLPGVVLARSEAQATYGVRLAVSADGSDDAVLSGVPAQMLRKADAQHHAVAQERLARDTGLRAQAVREVMHEVAEIEAAAQAVRAAASGAPPVQPLRLAQARPASPSPLSAPAPVPAPLPAPERKSLEVGDFAEVKLLGPPSEGKPGVWLACTISGARDAPHAYDIHFLGVPQAQREVQDVPSYMVRKADSKEYSSALRRIREDPQAAAQALMRLRSALGQGSESPEADESASRQAEESAKIRAAWDARKSGAKDRRRHEEEQRRLEGEKRLEDAEREQAVAEVRKQEQRKAALAAKRQAAQEAKRRADEEAKAEALRKEKEELKLKMEEEVRVKVEEELKKRKADEDLKKRLLKQATAELKRKRQAEQEAAAAKQDATAASAKEGSKESTSLKAMAQDGDSIRVRVRDQQGRSVPMKVGRRAKLRVLINSVCDRLSISRETPLLFNGSPIKPTDTAEALGLREQDVIEARA